ncbi:MAG TPA: DUF2520 domain-containing protein [Candidatus Anaerostipes avicola]|nr:DUF2520 domain-containing protein [Candidatus Anaerostipes avicola]
MQKVGFIGAGKVGCSLGDYFKRSGIEVAGYYSRTQAKEAGGAAAQDGTHIDSIDKLLTICDVLFLTVPDDAIADVWEQIRTFPIQGKYICHCSGSLSSTVLSGIRETGAYGYSIHPMFPFKSKKTAYEDLRHALFTVEGDSCHIQEVKALIRHCGNPVVEIHREDKPSYHAAAVFASNLMVGLMEEAVQLLMQCGFERKEAMAALKPLAVSNLENIFEAGTRDALTGPVERHDLQTVKKHLKVLGEDKKDTYISLTREIIKIAEDRHPEISYADMKQVLEEER